MWTYEVPTGKFWHNGVLIGVGYSGHGEGLNSVAHEADRNLGPIPRGRWTIGKFFDDPGGKGPLVAHLTPVEGTEVFGRDGFMAHGPHENDNHDSSLGCMILLHPIREQVAASGDRDLETVG